jgi:hypothetical protein
VFAASSLIEFTDQLSNNGSGFSRPLPLVLIMPKANPDVVSGPESGGSVGRRHSIGVFDEYFYCVMDEAKNPTYVRFFINIWPFIDLSMYAILPFCIMFICNIAIIKNVTFSPTDSLNSKLFKSNKKFKR